MNNGSPWFVQERAEYFSSLLLTEDTDVKVRPYAGDDAAFDLLVEVLKRGKATQRFFGVQVIGFTETPTIQDLNEKFPSQRRKNAQDAVLPICVFAIAVHEPKGLFCRWIAEPVVESGKATLHWPAAEWRPLNDQTVNRLVQQVNTWYDAGKGNGAKNGTVEGAIPRGNHSMPGMATEG